MLRDPHDKNGDTSAAQAEIPETRTERRRRSTHGALLRVRTVVLRMLGMPDDMLQLSAYNALANLRTD